MNRRSFLSSLVHFLKASVLFNTTYVVTHIAQKDDIKARAGIKRCGAATGAGTSIAACESYCRGWAAHCGGSYNNDCRITGSVCSRTRIRCETSEGTYTCP